MRKRLDSISVLRVLACGGVFACHVAPVSGAMGIGARIASIGASGVYLFFILSGFLAAGEGAFRRSGITAADYSAYAAKRLRRLLPMYYLVMLAQFVLHTAVLRDVPPDPRHLGWLRYLFLTNAVIPAPDNFWGNLGATWTVGLFVVSALLMPFALRWIRVGRGAVYRAAALYLALAALAGFWERAGGHGFLMCFHYLHYFALGALIRVIAEESGERGANAEAGAGGTGRGILRQALLYLGTVAACAATVYVLFRSIGYFTAVSWGYGLLALVTLPLSFGREDSLLKRAVSFLDRHSYGVYLVHAAVAEWLYLVKSHIPLSGLAVWVSAVVCTIIGTALVTFCERHLQWLYRPGKGCKAG